MISTTVLRCVVVVSMLVWPSIGGFVNLAWGQATFQGLGDLPGGEAWSSAYAISSDGLIVVGNSFSSSGSEAYRWTSGDGMIGLGDLPGGSFSSHVGDLSADGSVMVGIGWNDSGPEGYRWTDAGGMVGIPDSLLYGISADGSVLVGTGPAPLLIAYQAIRWSEAEGMVSLGVLFAGSYSSANGISADGTTIIGIGDVWQLPSFNIVDEPFRWTADEGMVRLGLLDGSTYCDPWSVSDDGSVIVGYCRYEDGYEAFRWTSDTGLVGLGFLQNGPPRSQAFAVSGDGLVIGGKAMTQDIQLTAVLWDASGIKNLQNVLRYHFGLDLTGWKLDAVAALSSDGLVMAGWGHSPTALIEGWIATLPAYFPPDTDDSGAVDVSDLLDLLSTWGDCIPPCRTDINADGVINVTDLLALLAAWGPNQ